jgi:hypothetical protein
MSIPTKYQNFINEHIKFLLELYNENYQESNKSTHGLIYVKDDGNDNVDVSYLTYDIIKDNNIISEDIINNIKTMNKKCLFIKNIDKTYLGLL